MGRMLNTITGGYAVGIAGIVAFLPFSSCSLVSAGRIGTLQAFYINQLKKDKRNIILVDARIAESSSYRGRAGEPTFGRGSRWDAPLLPSQLGLCNYTFSVLAVLANHVLPACPRAS